MCIVSEMTSPEDDSAQKVTLVTLVTLFIPYAQMALHQLFRREEGHLRVRGNSVTSVTSVTFWPSRSG